MAVQQLQLKKQEQPSTWSNIFPKEIQTLSQSTIFVKQLTAIAFSCITYMRSIFPDYAYLEKEIDEVRVKVLTGTYDCKDAYLMTRWIKSAFDALDQKYMRELVLEILSVDHEPLEYYAIVYKYTNEGPTFSFSANSKRVDFSMVEIQNATKELINTLLSVTETLGELPQKYTLQLRVNYYDEVTPSHYKPKFFSHAEPKDLKELEQMKHKVIGGVETPYLALDLYCGSTLVSLSESQEHFFKEMGEKSTLPSTMEEINDVSTTSTLKPEVISVNEKEEINEVERTWNLDMSASSNEDLSMVPTQVAVESQSETIACICGLSAKEKCAIPILADIFKCHECNTLHHRICYKILPGFNVKVKCCYQCAKSANKPQCTDPTLMKYKQRQAKHLTIYRQIVTRIQGKKTISLKQLEEMGLKSDLAENILSKFKNNNFIKMKKNSKLFLVNESKVKQFIKSYFEC